MPYRLHGPVAGAAPGQVSPLTIEVAVILPFWVVPGALFGPADTGPAVGVWYAQWAFALVPIALGLACHFLTLVVAFVFIRDCIRKGQFKPRSGLPIVGPMFISLGLYWSPSQGAVWWSLIPWILELTAAAVSVVVQRATRAGPS